MTEEAAALKAAWDPRQAELAHLLRQRSDEAWTEVYNQCYRPIYRYVHARVFDEAAAGDIASAVFAEAIASIGSYTYRGRPILAWLYRIARNLVADHQRKALRSRDGGSFSAFHLPRRFAARLLARQKDGIDPVEEVAANGALGDPAAMADHLDLRRGLAALPPAQREVLTLRYLVGLSTQEIAAVMGRQPAAVYSLHARALAALRKQMEGPK
jgi:RNA polymerase sigma-70 factor (ECF subfamily)